LIDQLTIKNGSCTISITMNPVQCKRIWKLADERAESIVKAKLHPEKMMFSVW